MSKVEDEHKKLINFVVCCLHCKQFVDFSIQTVINDDKIVSIAFTCKNCGLKEEAVHVEV